MVKKDKTEATPETEGERQLALAEEKAKYIAEIQDLNKQLQAVEAEISARVNHINQRELLLLAIAERKGIVAYINQKMGK